MCSGKSLPVVKSLCSAVNSSTAFVCLAFFSALFCACSQNPPDILTPVGDIRPPSIVGARQKTPGIFEIVFDEAVKPIPNSFSFSPAATTALPSSAGCALTVTLSPPVEAGGDCLLSGEAQDTAGNTTRFLFSFVGYNEDPAFLRLNEVQTGKNTASSNQHRDYMEFIVEKSGNLGGIHIQWASAVKLMSWTFPSCEAAKGSIIVLHCAPENIPEEKDEVGPDLSLSGGVDASSGGRDFWTVSGGIPDETGLILLRPREGDPPVDGIFFGSVEKTGSVEAEKIVGLLDEARSEGCWPTSSPPQWEEGFLWKSTASRPLHRRPGDAKGAERWYVGEPGSHSPGKLAPEPTPIGAKSGGKGRSKRH